MDQPPADAQEPDVSLTIGELAKQTALSPAVLRMWESRYGFPEPRRLASGHRRYAASDVEVIRQVLRRKDAGTRLEIAIADALTSRTTDSLSIFAELRRRHPSLTPLRVRKPTLIALSWAIEDECCAVADRPVLFGAFQRPEFYLPSAPRWRELARVARSAIVFADHWDEATSDADGPLQAALGPAAPLRREWSVVCDAQDSPACLAAWEMPGQAAVPDRNRVFETVWTVDATAVRNAARVAAGIAADAGVPGVERLVEDLAGMPDPRATSAAGATALFNRVVAYVDRLARP